MTREKKELLKFIKQRMKELSSRPTPELLKKDKKLFNKILLEEK